MYKALGSNTGKKEKLKLWSWHMPALSPVFRKMSGRRGTLMRSVISTKPAVQRTISDLMTCRIAAEK